MEELHQALHELIQSEPAPALDLGAVTSADAAALQLFCAARKSAECARKPLRFVAISDAVGTAAESIGFSLAGWMDAGGADGAV